MAESIRQWLTNTEFIQLSDNYYTKKLCGGFAIDVYSDLDEQSMWTVDVFSGNTSNERDFFAPEDIHQYVEEFLDIKSTVVNGISVEYPAQYEDCLDSAEGFIECLMYFYISRGTAI